jgi:hypothetical protein
MPTENDVSVVETPYQHVDQPPIEDSPQTEPRDDPNAAPSWTKKGKEAQPAPAAVADADDADEDERPEIGINEKKHEKIVERLRARRAQNEQAVRDLDIQMDGVDPIEQELRGIGAERDEPAQPPAPKPELTTLKIRNQSFQLTREQVLQAAGLTEEQAKSIPWTNVQAVAQRALAAHDYFNEAKQIHSQVSQQKYAPAQQPQPGQAQPPQQQADQPVEGNTSPDDDMLDKLVYGTPEEQKEAYARMKREAAEEAARVAQQRVAANFSQEQIAAQTNDAFASVTKRVPEIATDPAMSEMFGMQAAHLAKQAMIDAIRALPPDQQFAHAQRGFHEQRIAALADANQIGKLYKDMKVLRWPLPDPQVLINEAANRTLKAFNRAPPAPQQQRQAAPANPTPNRTERKAALASIPQRAAAPSPQQQPKRKSTAEIVADMRTWHPR